MTTTTAHGNKALLLTFALSLFLSAFLMFLLQPMIGKMLLPLVGGTPAGWIVAMAFFQTALLGGYFLAHFLSRLSVHKHTLAWLILLGISAVFLPVTLHQGADVTGTPTATDIFLLLTATLAAPFISLAATSSTLQRLFMTTGHPSAHDPYFLYAASNLGSFAGLLAYPFTFEIFLPLTQQAQYWLYGYLGLVAAGILCLLATGKNGVTEKRPETAVLPITNRQRLLWITLAFVPSSLMLGVTTHITTDIISAPMIWVIPLAFYLLTFVVAFSKKIRISANLIGDIHTPIVVLSIALLFPLVNGLVHSLYAMSWHLLAFIVTALMCHLRLAQSRPLGNDRGLTEFYLLLAVGGALGGLLNAFVAPALFNTLAEYPVVLLLSFVLNPHFTKIFSTRLVVFYLLCCTALLAYGILRTRIPLDSPLQNVFLFILFPMLVAHPRAALIGGASLFLITSLIQPATRDLLFQKRNFYGVIKIYETSINIDENKTQIRHLKHGTTHHGLQLLTPELEKKPTSYYIPPDDVFRYLAPRDIAVIGLGTGTLNCYATPQSAFTFIEIDSAVAEVATKYFTFLNTCKGRHDPRIIIGDGRLELEKLKNEKFDLIILDAFSSDAIPTHLLTREALQLYLQKLSFNGVLLLHISNRYFNLENVVLSTAASLGLQGRTLVQPTVDVPYAYPSQWVALARDDNMLLPLGLTGWKKAAPDKKQPAPWTDDYTNFLDAIALGRKK